MFLQRLEIQGFKSFAQKTVFEFPPTSLHDQKAQSITAIVGPNGSGKSNVADAIRWVLGEQSLKLIRCKKSEDVIFGGSEKKARQGFAEVSLSLNNEDQELPLEYSEVVLTRRVFREGETEYFINKSRTRLFDILLLLAKANFGQRSYSIIGQGMVDQIINISPWERKAFFDEATGVKQHQIKRGQAVNQLNRSRENLQQTKQIIAELEPRLRLLGRQIKKLEKRKEIEAQLLIWQKKYYGRFERELQQEQDKWQKELDIKVALRQEADGVLTGVRNQLGQYARSESGKDIFNNLQKEFSKLLTEKNEFLQELAVLKGKMNLEYVKIGKQNLAWLEDKREEINRRLAELEESQRNAENKRTQNQQCLTEGETAIKSLQKQLAVLENNLQSMEGSVGWRQGGSEDKQREAIKAVLRQREVFGGVFGTVNDLVEVTPEYQIALRTAAGHLLNAMVVQDEEVAWQCINFLKKNKLAPVLFLPLKSLLPPAPK